MRTRNKKVELYYDLQLKYFQTPHESVIINIHGGTVVWCVNTGLCNVSSAVL